MSNIQKKIQALINLLETNFGIKVSFESEFKESHSIGELKNNRIILNEKSRKNQEILFTIAHLFGHYIQLQEYHSYKNLVETVEQKKPIKLSESFKEKFKDYEKEAFEIGKKLLMQIIDFNHELERKYQIFFETDFEIFWDYLTTGKKTEPRDFNQILYHRYETDFKKKIPLVPKEFNVMKTLKKVSVKIE